MKHITKETILIQGEKEFKPVEVDGIIYWVDEEALKSGFWIAPIYKDAVKAGVELKYFDSTYFEGYGYDFTGHSFVVAKSQHNLVEIPLIDLQANNTRLIMEGEYPIDLNAYTEKDISKALDLARGNDFICLADGKEKLCHCRKDNECQHRHYKTNEEIISEVSKVESIEVDDNFEIIDFN